MGQTPSKKRRSSKDGGEVSISLPSDSEGAYANGDDRSRGSLSKANGRRKSGSRRDPSPSPLHIDASVGPTDDDDEPRVPGSPSQTSAPIPTDATKAAPRGTAHGPPSPYPSPPEGSLVPDSALENGTSPTSPSTTILSNPTLGLSTVPSNLPEKGRVTMDVDDMISRLLDVGYSGKVSKSVCLKNAEITSLCLAARDVFLAQPTLIELSPPVKIVGDVHGQYSDLIRLFEMCGFPPSANYLFLGDYVDRGKQSLETILLLLCYKVKYPENFFLLRGNHECANVTRGERRF